MRLFLMVLFLLSGGIVVNAQKNDSNLLNRVGETVTVSGKIYSGAFLTNVKTRPTFLNLGDTNPNHRLMIRIEPEDRDKFRSPPEIYFLNKQVSVTGVVNNYKGIPLIKISQPQMIITGAASAGINEGKNVGVIKSITTAPALPAVNLTKPQVNKPVEKKLPDTLLQSLWVNAVSAKNIEQINKNMRVVEKEIPLRISPSDDAPVIAIINPGIVISVLDKSRKWSHINVRTVDGSNSVFGFIKNRTFRHLKKLQ